MKTFAFERWCDRQEIPAATRDFLLRLRSSPPTRRVQGRLLNVCGTYASRKMGVSIQFESHAGVFFEGSIGCIGILKQWLVRALYRALREASTELTRTHLEMSVLPDAKWERMRADARSGEAEFQYACGQNSYLSDLASLPAFVPGQPASLQESRLRPAGQEADGAEKRDAHKPKNRPGEHLPTEIR